MVGPSSYVLAVFAPFTLALVRAPREVTQAARVTESGLWNRNGARRPNFEFIIKLQTSFGLKVPPKLLARAKQVIE